jgi:AcrR family transcriptional regulator
MDSILRKLKVDVNSNLYLKDPYSSDLGLSIVKEGSLLIHKLGMEQFTFKKLAAIIGSTEPAIYRYFENKHRLLLYLNAWYWVWLEHNLVFSTANMTDAKDRLEIALHLLVDGPMYRQNDFLDPEILRTIVVHESIKGYLTKEVDEEHASGIFSQVYKFGDRISSIVKEINPDYPFPKFLVSTIMESALLQSFNAQHLPGMVDAEASHEVRYNFFHQLVTKALV